MKKEEFCEILGDVKEEYILDAHTQRKRPISRYFLGGMAACFVGLLIAIACIVSPSRKSNSMENAAGMTQEISLYDRADVVETPKFLTVNWVESVSTADMDVGGFQDWPGAAEMTVEESFQYELGIPYDEFTARLPEKWEITDLSVLTVPDFDADTMEKTYRPHDFILHCKIPGSGEARIALCGAEEPLRDVFFISDMPLVSQINGVPVEVYAYQTTFWAYCSDGVMFYDIETENVTLLELELLLESLL